jgi:hypothetical protein
MTLFYDLILIDDKIATDQCWYNIWYSVCDLAALSEEL